jgi:hypothetical protein
MTFSVRTAGLEDIVTELNGLHMQTTNSIKLLNEALPTIPPDENLLGITKLFLYDFEQCQQELTRLVDEIPKCSNQSDALSRHANALRKLSEYTRSMKDNACNLRKDYGDTALWFKVGKDIFKDVAYMANEYWGLTDIADRLDVLFVSPEKRDGDLRNQNNGSSELCKPRACKVCRWIHDERLTSFSHGDDTRFTFRPKTQAHEVLMRIHEEMAKGMPDADISEFHFDLKDAFKLTRHPGVYKRLIEPTNVRRAKIKAPSETREDLNIRANVRTPQQTRTKPARVP